MISARSSRTTEAIHLARDRAQALPLSIHLEYVAQMWRLLSVRLKDHFLIPSSVANVTGGAAMLVR
jgi:hypothetical protein